MRNSDSMDVAISVFAVYWVIVFLSPIEVALDTLALSFAISYVGYVIHFYHREKDIDEFDIENLD